MFETYTLTWGQFCTFRVTFIPWNFPLLLFLLFLLRGSWDFFVDLKVVGS